MRWDVSGSGSGVADFSRMDLGASKSFFNCFAAGCVKAFARFEFVSRDKFCY